MTTGKYVYPAEKLADARRILMIPHPQGEAQDIVPAFFECSLGLSNICDADLDDDAQSWVRTIRQMMDMTGIDEGPQEREKCFLKAEKLNIDEKSQFSSAVDELADWFHEQSMDR